MAQFESQKQQIEGTGAQPVFVAAEKRNGIWKPDRYLEKHPISYPFLLDEDRSVTKAYGLHHPFGTDAINIARPATLIIDRGGIVRYIYRGHGQLDRVPLNDVLDALKKLKE